MSNNFVDAFLRELEHRNDGQKEFLQAVRELVDDVCDEIGASEVYRKENLLSRLTEPDRIITFRVCWEDDQGQIHVNRGWRVQHSNLIGPYKGGIRFHPSVNESVLKFLAFEQTFKNALTGMNIGGAKGGSDFDPSDRSDREINRFCNAFMDELYRHIGEKTDVPAGDINVGSREIGFLFGHYRRLANNFSGALTGKDIEFGGSPVRLEATGFGLVYFVREMLKIRNEEIEGKRIAVSGAGNVAIHAALKAAELGARVITLSSRKGTFVAPDGFGRKTLEAVRNNNEDSTSCLSKLECDGHWKAGAKPWEQACDIALPCATENELDENDARQLVENDCRIVAEGANMPCTEPARVCLEQNRILHAPGKAANAGGVALSALEMGQNTDFVKREYEDLDTELKKVMCRIHDKCVEFSGQRENGFIHYRRGANRAAFKRVAKALIAQGIS